jgi:Domain of unknown function (DUF6458)
MGIGTSIFLIAVGAILAFAVHVTNTSGIDLHTIGWILMIVGGIGALLSLVFWSSWGGVGTYRRRVNYVERPGGPVVDQRDVY